MHLLRSVLRSPCALALAALGCTPRVQLEAPKDPIVINMNIKIEQEVRVKIEQQAQEDIAKNPDIF